MAKVSLQRVGAVLRERRGGRGLRGVASEIGISPATLSRVERGKLPDLETFSKICQWLRIDPGEVLGVEREADSKNRDVIDSVHFRADRALNPDAAHALAEMILAAQRMIARTPRK